jgi:L-gulonolactone oxidase
MVTAERPRWTNWGRTQSCAPAAVHSPGSEAEIAELMQEAGRAGQRVKVVGAGHSFTDIACTDGRLLRLDRCDRVLDVDTGTGRVTVEAGITIAALNRELARHGLALENLGDVAYQTIAGAISTGTHGTGATKPTISGQVVGLSLVLADGTVLRCSDTEEVEAFRAAQVGLGALGVISTVTLRCVPAFDLHSVEEPRRLDEVLERFDELAAANEHFELFWFPHTDVAQTIANNRADGPRRPKGAARAYVDDILLENHAFGLVQRLGHARRSWIPGLARLSGRLLSRSEVVDRSDRVFANERLVRFAEMEYAIPREHVVEAVRELRAMIERSGLRISFPVEIRVLAGDDIPLSTAQGRDSAYIAVHVYWRQEHEPYFRQVEAIMAALQGRPHWGKLHYQTAEALRPRYPLWDRFLAVRDRLDPERRFQNAYLERVLGP